MVAVFRQSERSEPETCRRRSLELNTAGEQQGVKDEFPPESPEMSMSVKQEEATHMKEEKEEADITVPTVKREEDEVHLSGINQSLKEENTEDDKAAEAARTSGPEGLLGAGGQQQFVGVKEELPPEQQERSISVKQEEAELPHIKEEEADINAVTVKREDDEVHLSWFDQSLKEENREEERAAESARTSGPEGLLRADQQLPVKTPSLEQEETESCDFKVKEEAEFAVKSEGNEERAEFREDCGGPGLARNSATDGHFGPGTEDETHSSETEDSDDWMKSLAPHKHSCLEHCKTCACKSSLLKQFNNEFERKLFDCSECGKKFKLKHNLRAHEKFHTGEKPFSCSQCGKEFARKGTLRAHEKIHTRKKPFSCCQCGKGFTKKYTLRQHEVTHTGEKPFSCSQCDKRFALNSGLRKHEIIHSAEKPFCCSQCDQRFKRKSGLKLHEMNHNLEKPFSCSQCDKRFARNSGLRKHEIIHSVEKPFCCSQCDQRFKRKSGLKLHETIHNLEKPFSCSQCVKRFSDNGALRKHEIIHTEEKPFSCSQCDKRFRRKTDLRRHESIHIGEKPFICTLCGETFTQRCKLWAHEKIHTGKERWNFVAWHIKK